MTNQDLAEVLASYVPKLIQKRVAENPAPIESPVSEQTHAVVLFADISGFTRLTEKLAEAGPAGAEQIANILNEYFGKLIDIVLVYGGDIVKFAGDAVIVVWPIASTEGTPDSVSATDTWQEVLRASECALEVRKQLSDYHYENERLYLKLAISVGDITTAHVGGVFNRWEFLLAGNPLVEVGIANNITKAGEVILTPSAWRVLRNDCEAETIEFELKDAIAQGGKLKSLAKHSAVVEQPVDVSISEQTENSLRPYIPGAIINRLTAGQSSWIAELRRATVLFINLPDIDERTPLAESQNIARLIQRSVYRYEGSINKISVDDKGITIVAALGLPPFSHEDDPARGLQAALLIRKELSAVKTRSNIGVATGRIFCGSIGNDLRREYTTIGNAVNLSARLMTAAGHQADLVRKYNVPILCDRVTFDAAKDIVEFQVLPPQQLKGRSEAIEVFHPVELKTSVIRLTTEMIGRQDEKSVIANDLQELSRGAPHHTLIVQGEAGIGKSRLFEDLVRQAETLHVQMLTSGGDPIERSTPYHVWRSIFYKVFDIEELAGQVSVISEARNTIQNKVIAKLQEIDTQLVRYYPLLDVVLPIQVSDNELTAAMTGEIRGGNIREMLTQILSFEASHSPLLVVLEDLHWFDSASLNVLIDVQQKVRPIFLALNTRPLPDSVALQYRQLQEHPDSYLIKLEAMMLDEVESLVCQRLGVKSVPPLIGRLIREKSEGNPFFAEELAYALRDSGVLVIQDHECRIHSRFMAIEDISLPDSLQAAIINRIDSLNPAQQLTLKVASVIGRIFALKLLTAIHPIDADRPLLSEYMDSLNRQSLTMIESETPDLAYIFKHAVTQEVAYNLMLFSQRRQLHQAVAEWIETNHADNLDNYYALLAHHWTQSAEVHDTHADISAAQKAVEFLEKAGDQAMANYANREAVQFYSQALEWEEKLPAPEKHADIQKRNLTRARWHRCIGLAHYSMGSLPDCDTHVRAALRLLDSRLPSNSLQFALGLLPQAARQAIHRYFPSKHIGVLQGYNKEMALEAAQLYELMSRIYFYSNHTLAIVYTVLRCLNDAEKAGISPELVAAYANASVLAGVVQAYSPADAYMQRSMETARSVNKPSSTITANIATSAYQITVGSWAAVWDKLQVAKGLCEQLGDYRQWGDAMVLLGESSIISGNMDTAKEIYDSFIVDARRRHNPLQESWALFGLSVIHLRRGEEAQAVPMLEEMLQILERQPNVASAINTNGQLALAYLRVGDLVESLVHAGKVLELGVGLRPTVYSLDIGISAAARVYFELWESALQDQTEKKSADEYRKLAEKSLKILQNFKGVFPIGRSYFAYFKGWHYWLSGKNDAAIKAWKQGLEAAQKYRLLYEEGLIRTRLGMFLPVSDSSMRREHLERAIHIFSGMGAVRDLYIAEQTLNAIK